MQYPTATKKTTERLFRRKKKKQEWVYLDGKLYNKLKAISC